MKYVGIKMENGFFEKCQKIAKRQEHKFQLLFNY